MRHHIEGATIVPSTSFGVLCIRELLYYILNKQYIIIIYFYYK